MALKRSVILLEDEPPAPAKPTAARKVGGIILLVLRQLMGPHTSKADRAAWFDSFMLEIMQRLCTSHIQKLAEEAKRVQVSREEIVLFESDEQGDPELEKSRKRQDACTRTMEMVRASIRGNDKPFAPFKEVHLIKARERIDQVRLNNVAFDAKGE